MRKKNNQKKYFIIMIVLVVSAFFMTLLQANNIYLWDEAVFLSSAETLGYAHPYYTEIDYRPPLIILLVAFGSLFANIEIAAHIIVAIFFALAVGGIFLLGKETFNEKVGIFASILLILAPYFIHWSPKIMNDVPSFGLSLFLFYFLFKWQHSKNRLFLFLSGIFCGFCILMRFTSLMFVPLGFLFIFFVKSKFKEKVSYSALFLVFTILTLVPYMLWVQFTQNQFHHPFPFPFITLLFRAQAIAAGSIPAIIDPLFYFKASYILIAPVGLAGLILYIVSIIKNKKIFSSEVFLWIWFISFFIYFSIMAHKEVRYLLPAIPPLLVLASLGYSRIRIPQMKTSFRKIVVLIFVLIIVLLLIFTFYNFNYFSGKMDFGEDIMLERSAALKQVAPFIKENLLQDEVIYADSLYPNIAYYTKRKTIATWPWDQEFYKKFPENMPYNGYYVKIKGIDKEPNEEWLDNSPFFRKIKEEGIIIIYEYKRPIVNSASN